MPAHHTDPSHTDTVHTTGSTVPATYSPIRTPTCPTQRAAAGMARGPGACRGSDVAYTGRPHGLAPSPRPPANAKAAVAPQPPTKVWAQRRPAGMVGGMDADIRGQKYPQAVVLPRYIESVHAKTRGKSEYSDTLWDFLS